MKSNIKRYLYIPLRMDFITILHILQANLAVPKMIGYYGQNDVHILYIINKILLYRMNFILHLLKIQYFHSIINSFFFNLSTNSCLFAKYTMETLYFQ